MNTNRQALPDDSGRTNSTSSAWLGKALALLLGVAALVVGVMFSVLALVVLLVVGAVIFAVLTWKTRHVRRQLQRWMVATADGPVPAWREDRGTGTIIEGEAVRQSANDQEPTLGVPGGQGPRPRA